MRSKDLHSFVMSSLAIILIAFFSTAFFFSKSYLLKEQARAELSKAQLLHFLDFKSRPMGEEMWTKNYDAINDDVKAVVREIGNASYSLILADENLKCVYSTEQSKCISPDILNLKHSEINLDPPKPYLEFDENSSRYVYVNALKVGPVLKGYIVAKIEDPFQFYRGNTFLLVLKTAMMPSLFLVLVWLLSFGLVRRLFLKPYLENLVQLERKNALADLAAQVAHDIRSPLVALKSVLGTLQVKSETERKLLNASASRIESIANDLLIQFKGESELAQEAFCFVSLVVDSIVDEKIAALTEKSNIEIICDLSDDLFVTRVPLVAKELARVLSNVVSNSIEAISGDIKGHILISAKTTGDRVLLSVTDNGKGMTSDVLHKIRTSGGSYGKAGGFGMGISHAKSTLANIGGNISIESKPDHGTTITLEMPIAPLPAWCASSIDLSNARKIVVLDDDESVHLLWKKRLGTENVYYLTDPEQFNLETYPPAESFYIFDYEITGCPITGLDLIISHKLAQKSILVTSYFNEVKIQSKIIEANAKMLPKFMITKVEIKLPPERNRAANQKEQYDLILIDDDNLIHMTWRLAAKERGLKLKAVFTLSDLDLTEIERSTPIFIDKNMGNVSGIDVARTLHQLSFTNLTLATGEQLEKDQVPAFFREVIGKDFPNQFQHGLVAFFEI